MISPTTRKLIEVAWGPGVRRHDGVEWVDTAGVWRASLRPSPGGDHLEFSNYVPFSTWLGEHDKIVALPKAVLAATVDAIQSSYGSSFVREREAGGLYSYSLERPPTEWSEYLPFTGIEVSLAPDSNDVVRGFSFTVGFDSTNTRDVILAQLERKWGKGTKTPQGDWSFSSTEYGTVHVGDLNDGLSFTMHPL